MKKEYLRFLSKSDIIEIMSAKKVSCYGDVENLGIHPTKAPSEYMAGLFYANKKAGTVYTIPATVNPKNQMLKLL